MATNVLQLGDKAPDFVLKNTKGESISLSNLQKDEVIILLFFPLAFSKVCTEEMCTIRDNMKLYESLKAKVIGISVDSFFTLKAFKKAENLNFTLLSDFNKKVSSDYGAIYDDYFGMKGVSKRAAFVIGNNQIIQHREVLEDSGELPDYKAILRTISSRD